jgi:predicted kinase
MSMPADDPRETGVLYFLCGRAGAGKTTLARKMSRERGAILICEDQWLVHLFDGAATLQEYIERRGRIRRLLVEHVPAMLAAGHSVVFDFGGNTIGDRAWVRSVFESAGARHELHYIVADESLCLSRIHERNRTRPAGIYWGDVSDELVAAVNVYFQPPTIEEGFTLVEHVAGVAA